MTTDDFLPDTLVVSGGGVRAAAALGAAHALRGRACGDRLRGVTRFVGTSAGALVAACLAVRADPVAAMRAIEASPFRADLAVADFGVDSGAHLRVWIRGVLGADADATFADVRARHGTDLVVCVTDLHARRAVYMGPDSHPHTPVALALRMSCGVPVAFGAVRYEGGLYVDGALRDNFPMAWALQRSDRVLGVCFAAREPTEIATTADFITAVCECAVPPALVPPGVRADRVLMLRVPSELRSLDLRAARPRTLRRLFNAGAAQARDFVKKHA